MNNPSRGEVWFVNLNPVKGHEQAGVRPALVMSVDEFNNSAAGLVILLPITSKDRGIPLHITVNPPEGGLKNKSFVKCENIRCVSKERLIKCIGYVSSAVMEEVEDRIRIILNL